MLKRILVTVLSITMLLSLSACAKTEEDNTNVTDPTVGADSDKEISDNDEDISDNDEDISDKDIINSDYRTEPNTKEEEAIAAYLKYLKENDFEDMYNYEFVYIDEDDIPELVAYPGAGCLALSYYNGEVIRLCYSSATFFDYVEKQGYFHYGGMYREDFYERLSYGQSELMAYYEPVLNGAEYTGDNIYYIGNMDNNKEVSKDEYDTYISSLGYTDTEHHNEMNDNLYKAYLALKGIDDNNSANLDEEWKRAYFDYMDFENTENPPEYVSYSLIDANNDSIPELFVADIDANAIYAIDKLNNVTELGYGFDISVTDGGSIIIMDGYIPQTNDMTFTEYKYYAEASTWIGENQLSIDAKDDFSTSYMSSGYDTLYKDPDLCSYKVNGKDYSSYDEAVRNFSYEYADGKFKTINLNEGNYEFYDYWELKDKIVDYGLYSYKVNCAKLSEFEFEKGKLTVKGDAIDISYPIAKECK